MILYHSRASNVHDLDSLRLNELCKLLVGIAFCVRFENVSAFFTSMHTYVWLL